MSIISSIQIFPSLCTYIFPSSWCTKETRKEKGWERWSVGIELWKKLLDYRVGYYADDAVSLVVIFIPVAHLLRKVFTHMCAPIVSHAERNDKCVCLLRVVDKSAEARGAWWFFKIHSRHAKKRTTGADDRDILSFPSQGSSGVANILNSNHLLIIVYSRPCLFERLGIFRQEWGLLFSRFNSCYKLIKISNFVIVGYATVDARKSFHTNNGQSKISF